MGLGYDDGCSFVTPSESVRNIEVCGNIDKQKKSAAAVAVSTGAVFRIASREFISPFARVSAGILFTNQSSLLTEGVSPSNDGALLIIYDDDKRTRIRPAFALGVGTTFAINRGYYLRWEVRDNLVGLVKVTGPTDGPRFIPPHKTVYKHLFSLQIGINVVLEKERGRRTDAGRALSWRAGGPSDSAAGPRGWSSSAVSESSTGWSAMMTAALGAPPLLVANNPDAPSWRPDLRVVRRCPAGSRFAGRDLHRGHRGAGPGGRRRLGHAVRPAALVGALARGLDSCDAMLPRERRAAAASSRSVPRTAAPGGRPSRASLDAGDLRAVAFHPRIKIGILPLDGGPSLRRPCALFFNVNTADDLAKANELWQPGSSR